MISIEVFLGFARLFIKYALVPWNMQYHSQKIGKILLVAPYYLIINMPLNMYRFMDFENCLVIRIFLQL